jgi:4'-phosphopantetheinyl transferase
MGDPELRWARPGLSAGERIEYLRRLPDAERVRLAGVRAEARDSFLQGRALLATLADAAGEHGAIAALCPDCGGPHGRPMIDGSRLRLGLSHCATAVVAVSSWGAAVGVDVERRAASAARLDAIDRLTGHRSIAHWTAVEAVLKADGRGLRVDPSQVVIERGEARVLDRPQRYRLMAPELDESLQVSVAVAV